ncbi:MAG: AAA family ATPase, partial [Prevotellaceae bacterium]|nr:AAA family ATPase [Prevotellaceae bacterium]
MDTIKDIPYGISDFEQIIGDNYYFVDKSKYITLVEKSRPNLLMIRPRRFGKSLFVGMLSTYYDILQKDRFDEVFGNLWIGKHPTKNQGRFQVLRFDFSKVGGASSIGELKESFNTYCGGVVDKFANKYAAFYPPIFLEDIRNAPTAQGKLNLLDIYAKDERYPLYLILDEYDNFTNIVLGEHGHDKFHQITHATGFYRDVFKIFKGMFYRIFMTGVSPVTLDDLTSGFNIDWNISNSPRFNAMMGFSETDVREMFQYYKDAGALTGEVDAMIEEMRPWYDNYCFSKGALDEPRIFNCDMTLYYLNNRVEEGTAPEQMLSKNVRTDFSKLKMLA